jgi:hypothetical protein
VKVATQASDVSAHANLLTKDLQTAVWRLTLLSGRRDQKPVVSVIDLSPIEDSFLVCELPTNRPQSHWLSPFRTFVLPRRIHGPRRFELGVDSEVVVTQDEEVDLGD